MSTFFASLTHLEILFLGGVAGALFTLPLKDIISFEFYDICDVFLSLMVAALTFGFLETDHPSTEDLLLVMALASIGIIFVKIFVVVPFQRRAENSSVQSMQTYIGMTGTLTVSVAKEGIGEILISTPFGRRNHMARLDENERTRTLAKIPAGETVRVARIEDGILYVEPMEKEDLVISNQEYSQGK